MVKWNSLFDTKRPGGIFEMAHFLGEALVETLKLRDRCGLNARGRLRDRKALQRQPHFRISRTPALIAIGTDRAVRQDFKSAFCSEALHSLRTGIRLVPKALVKLTQRDLFAGLDPADHQIIPQLTIDALPERLAFDDIQTGETWRFEVHVQQRDDERA